MATPAIPIPDTNLNRRPWKIVSGGQTGVDRAGLVAAMALGILHAAADDSELMAAEFTDPYAATGRPVAHR